MRYALVKGGKVANIVMWDSESGNHPFGDDIELVALETDTSCDIGWPVVDGAVVPIQAAIPVSVPGAVSMAQARLALLDAGLLPRVEAALVALPSPEREAAQIAWNFRPTVERKSALVLTLSKALGLDDHALDKLFVEAAQM